MSDDDAARLHQVILQARDALAVSLPLLDTALRLLSADARHHGEKRLCFRARSMVVRAGGYRACGLGPALA